MSTQRVRNLITKILKEDALSAKSTLKDYLATMESEGGTIGCMYDVDESVDALFLSSANMRKKFVECNPYVIQMDTTFSIEKGRYKLVAFCYRLDLSSNKTENAGFRLISNERDNNFNFVLSNFKLLNSREDYIFLVDKYFSSIDCIKTNFKEVVVLLCQFHLLKFMKNLIATALATVEIKGEMMTIFKS
mgnify:CR=1 FL=1